MQLAACFNSVDIPLILQNLIFPHTSFVLESFLNISNHWPTAHLHISLFDLVNPLVFANRCPGWHNYSFWGLLFQFHSLLALKFHWVKMCFGILYWQCQHSKLFYYFQIGHAQTSLLVNCAGNSQGVQLLDQSNMGQIWAIRF